MDIARLRTRGWTEEEIGRVKAGLARAEKKKHPHLKMLERACLWLLVATLLGGAIAAVIGLLPLLVLTQAGLPLLFLIGTCYGLLLVHALHDLGLERAHQHVGVAVLIMASVIAITLLLDAFGQRLGPLHPGSASALFSAGIIIPYLVHWRASHGTA